MLGLNEWTGLSTDYSVMKGFDVDHELLSWGCSLICVFCPLVGSKVLCGVNTKCLKDYFFDTWNTWQNPLDNEFQIYKKKLNMTPDHSEPYTFSEERNTDAL